MKAKISATGLVRIFGLSMILSVFFCSTAMAQFTILPQADPQADCKDILDKFELDTTLLSQAAKQAAEQYAQEWSNAAALNSKAANEAKQKYNDLYKQASEAQGAVEAAQKEMDNLPQCDQTVNPQACADRDAAQQKINGLSAQATGLKMQLAEAEQDWNNKQSTYEKSKSEASKANDKAMNSKYNNEMNMLGCGIKTGRVSLAMIPYYIKYFINYLLSLIGIISVFFIVLGGYFYIWGGLTEKKEKGKQFITHALMGLAIASLAWMIVNAVMAIFTS